MPFVLSVCVCRLLQGQERSISLPLTYANIGTEEARNVQLYISDFPDTVFEDIRLSLDVGAS